jgi:O-Antigen ligase/PDZ domain
MIAGERSFVPDAGQPASPGDPSGILASVGISRRGQLLDGVIFVFFLLFATALPHSIKGAERAWKIAFVLWLLKLAIERVRPLKQPLVAPLIAYVTLSGISTALSPDPYLSWDRMKFVCLYLVAILFAQNLRRLSQVRWLVILLVLSGFAAALYTGWQYTFGIGVRLTDFSLESPLARLGFLPGDTITTFDGHKVHSPDDLVRAVREAPASTSVNMDYLRGAGFRQFPVTISPAVFVQSGLGTAALKLNRGTPARAQGTLGHYVVFAEMLMQIGCMAWALIFTVGRTKSAWTLLFVVAFASITAALLATSTRAQMGGLVLGCLVTVLLLSARKARFVAVAALLVILAAAAVWIQHSRAREWKGGADVSTHFRVLMWEDGARLVRQHPWFGIGMETVRVHYREWNIRGFLQYHVVSHFHSTYLQIAVERGIPALLAWLWFCGAYYLFLTRLIRRLRAENRFALGVTVAALAGFLAFSFTSFFHYNLGEESLAMIFFFYVGLTLAIDRMTATPGAMDVS